MSEGDELELAHFASAYALRERTRGRIRFMKRAAQGRVTQPGWARGRRMFLLGLLALAVVPALTACEQQQRAIEQDLPAARATKARADAQTIANAVKVYAAALGALPDSLEALTTTATVSGVSGGPFLGSLPAPPAGWSPYQYTRGERVDFTISTSGQGTSVVVGGP